MKILRLETRFEIPSLNKWERTNQFEKARIKGKLAEEISIMFVSECRYHGFRSKDFGKYPKITYFSYRKRKITDYDNWIGGMKPLNDALVRAGIIADDNIKDFHQGEHKQFISSNNPRTVIFIQEI